MHPVSNVEHSHKKIAIIDYGLGNLFSVNQAFRYLGAQSFLTDKANEVAQADAIVLPGVGAFGQAMENLRRRDLVSVIHDTIAERKQFFGVCLGLQLLFEESEEFGSYRGLGLVSGLVRKFPPQIKEKKLHIPQIAWNKVIPAAGTTWENTCMQGIRPESYVYFVHSYYTEVTQPTDRLCMTNYDGFEYCSAIERDNIFAVQFHPEKSAQVGAHIYNNWLNKIQ